MTHIRAQKRRGLTIFLGVVVLLIAVSMTVILRSHSLREGTMELHFLDVGQGDSALLLAKEGGVLIDTGESDAKEIVLFTLSSRLRRLDYLVITHAHTDHMGGAAYLLRAMEVGTVVLPRQDSEEDAYIEFLAAVTDSGADIVFADPGTTFTLGEARFRILGPLASTDIENDQSTILRLDFGQTSALFTGDAEEDSEKALLATYTAASGGLLDTDVLKVGHHGSDSSSTDEFLQAVSPKWAVISCGKENGYGHPHRNVVTRLQDAGATVRRTDACGTVILVTNGVEFWEKSPC